MYFIQTVNMIELGVEGENNNIVQIDVSEWLKEEPNGSFQIIAVRPGETTPYLAVAALNGNVLEWTVGAGDVGVSGKFGRCDIRMYAGDRIKKTRVCQTSVDATLPGTTEAEVPEAYQGWVDEVAANGLKAEGWAVGKQSGADVGEGSIYYHNNSKYYSEVAGSHADDANDAKGSAQEAATDAINAYVGAQLAAAQAETAATNAASSATSASADATLASAKASAARNSATAALTAQTAAETAQTAAETAQTAAETAKSGAESAQAAAAGSATAAASSEATVAASAAAAEAAKVAAQSAQSAAETAKTNAQTAATSAAASAASASADATLASEKATAAGNSATAAGNAKTAAEAAQTAAETAESNAETAQTAAEAAAAAAEEAAEDVQIDPIPLEYTEGTVNRAVNHTNGNNMSSDISHAIDYIDISAYHVIEYTRRRNTNSASNAGMAFYDEDKVYISGQGDIVEAEENAYELTRINVPDGAVYARFTAFKDHTIGLFGVAYLPRLAEELDKKVDAKYNADDKGKTLGIGADGTVEPIGYKGTVYTTMSVVQGHNHESGHSSNSKEIRTDPIYVGKGNTVNLFIDDRWYYDVLFGAAQTETDRYFYEKNVRYTQITAFADYISFNFRRRNAVTNVAEDIAPAAFGNAVVMMIVNDSQRYIHDVPHNIGVLNAIMRARQLSDIRYTTAAEMRMLGDGNEKYTVPAGTELKGLCYSNTREEYEIVPAATSIHTFMTAVKDPNSYQYTRYSTCEGSNPYYGSVCSSLVGYALGIDDFSHSVPTETGIDGLDMIDRPRDIYAAKLGDVLINSGHTAIITDIARDADGRIRYVEVVESTKPLCLRRYYRVAADGGVKLFSIAWGGYDIYRYSKIDDVKYTANPWINLGDENGTPVYSTNVCTKRGDKSNWSTADTIPYQASTLSEPNVEIDVLDSEGYTGYAVEKDGTVIDTGEIPADGVITVAKTNGAGKYKCYLIGDGENSVATEWILYNVSGTATAGAGKVTYTFSADANTTPTALVISTQAATTEHKYKLHKQMSYLTADEIAAGEAEMEVAAGTYWAKVTYMTEFGMVSGENTLVTVTAAPPVPPEPTIEERVEALEDGKVDIQQDVADSGKVLGIGADGKVTPVTGGGGGASYTINSVTIAAADWSSQSATKSVAGVTANNLVQITPVAQTDEDIWYLCGVFCSAQASGTLTFTCTTAPTSALELKVIVWS